MFSESVLIAETAMPGLTVCSFFNSLNSVFIFPSAERRSRILHLLFMPCLFFKRISLARDFENGMPKYEAEAFKRLKCPFKREYPPASYNIVSMRDRKSTRLN